MSQAERVEPGLTPPGKTLTPLLEVKDLQMHFPVRKGVFSRVCGAVRAVDGVSFSIEAGKTLSLVGESGSGKTTTGRALLRLIEPTGGEVFFAGQDVTHAGKDELRALRKQMQIIFQDPFGSLNPRMTVYGMLSEILKVHRLSSRKERRERVEALLSLVGLPKEAADRYPHEFSGGQRQRIGIARALAVEPKLIVADEPVSALDVSIQAQILNLLEELQDRLGLAYLFIGHDLSVVRHISDEVAVMYLGKIVEIGPKTAVFENPVHPYTRALLSAAPMAGGGPKKQRIVLKGDIPSPIAPPPGCAFHPRCPDAQPQCRQTCPQLESVGEGHRAACLVHAPGDRLPQGK